MNQDPDDEEPKPYGDEPFTDHHWHGRKDDDGTTVKVVDGTEEEEE
jgi:hypothetical protein